MSTLDLRNKVINQLNKADESLLKEILELIEFETDETVYNTNSKERAAIKEGQDQIKSGNWYTNEKVDKEIDEWLEK